MNKEEKSTLGILLRRKQEAEGVLLMLTERARSGLTKSHIETKFLAQVVEARLEQLQAQIIQVSSTRTEPYGRHKK